MVSGIFSSSQICTEEQTSIAQKVTLNKNVVLYNDDVNTFEYVIEALIEVCNHNSLQAEQCTYLVHYKGKCAVKTGKMIDLRPVQIALLDRGLTASIE
ncbi:MAG: ATP-dependent Clp protease adaptor ClpS [Bacteroidetes bacterium]|nr:ATP-dependent Clp protease adaptor ClpS [Bacteroidota bacterium]HET6243551.1 ATP-dependent Clp protease adaptor ClpS [Bacteroidia bacterium]